MKDARNAARGAGKSGILIPAFNPEPWQEAVTVRPPRLDTRMLTVEYLIRHLNDPPGVQAAQTNIISGVGTRLDWTAALGLDAQGADNIHSGLQARRRQGVRLQPGLFHVLAA